MTRMGWLPAIVFLACGCATLTKAGSQVTVYRASLEVPAAQRAMPEGCALTASKPVAWMTELDLEGSKDPYLLQRNETGAAGGNVLLVLSRRVTSRRDFECPSSSPITDCPGSSGGWFKVAFESYTCTPDALQNLMSPARAAK